VESTIRVPVLTILPIPFLRVSGAFPVHGAPRFSKISCRLLHRSNSVRSSLTHESPVCSNHPQQCLARWGSQATGRMQVWSHTPGQRRCLPRTATKGILALPVKSVISACGCQLWRSRRTCRLDCRGSCPSWKKPLRRPRKRNAYQTPSRYCFSCALSTVHVLFDPKPGSDRCVLANARASYSVLLSCFRYMQQKQHPRHCSSDWQYHWCGGSRCDQQPPSTARTHQHFTAETTDPPPHPELR
jgi:hypothetical protein